MANTNSNLVTDLSASPFYDDFDPTQDYYRILYRPGFAVQARELTQSQTILQNQISSFGKHIFREGSIVLPGQFSIETDVDYVKVKDVNQANNDVIISNFKNETIYGETNGISAHVIEVIDGTEASGNTKTLFIRYQSSALANSQIKTFSNDEILSSNEGGLVVVSANSTGKGSRFVISEGVFFAKDHFIRFPTQTVVLSRYSQEPTCRVGFNISEDIVRYTEDNTLLDPALESSNYSAPGADRLKLTATLSVLDINDNRGAPDFVELFTINEGIITELYERPQYNIIQDELAKRTFDESGDYYVSGLSVRVRENLDTGDNGGLSNTGNSQILSIGVEPGVGYVKGYEVGKLVTEYIPTNKSTTYENVNSQIISTNYGSYVVCNEAIGSIKHDEGTIVHLFDGEYKRLSERRWISGAPTSNPIGTAKVFSVEYNSGSLGSPQGNVNIYLADIKMNGTNSFASARSIYTPGFGADIIVDSANNAVLKETATSCLVYDIGASGVRTLRDSSGSPDMTFNFKRTTDVSVSSGGDVDVSASSPEVFPYGTATLGAADKTDILFSLQTAFNISLPGTVSATAGQKTLTGSSTFFTRLNPGDKVELSANNAYTYFIDYITSDTSMNVTEALPVVSGNAIFKAYEAGDIIDLRSKGVAAGIERGVDATSSQLAFSMNENWGTTRSAKITYQIAKTGAHEINKNLRAKRFVVINCSSHEKGTTGPYSLGFPDVYQIRNIIKKSGSIPSDLGDGTDVTSSFIFDNGQRDLFYDLATITPKPSAGLTASDRLLVYLDWFEPNYSLGTGYFSVDSYPIDDTNIADDKIRTENIPRFTSPTSKRTFDLRNCVDFRPTKTKTAADSTTIGGAAENPAEGDFGFNFEINGIRLPAPSTQANFDYSFYHGRRDLVVIDKDGNIAMISGVPGLFPRSPLAPDNFMALANIYIAPYPSLAPNYAHTINRRDLACEVTKLSNIRHTMRDIGVIKSRVINLEYYAALNLLEKSALEMQIVDENGLSRFKNGIFVDTFSDHSLGDIRSPDYRIVVDKQEKSIRPIYTMDSLYYDYLSGSNIVRNGDLITLPYTSVSFITQPVATSYRNIELSSYRFIGNLLIEPDTDVWVDTEYLPDEHYTIGSDESNVPQVTTTEWNAWQETIVGYYVDPGKGKAVGSYWYGGTYSSVNAQIISNSNSPRDQKVTALTSSTRTGTETYYDLEENTIELGQRVVNTSLVPYIRNQTLLLNGRGLKANTQVYVFFDGEDMNKYSAPLTKTEWTNFPGRVAASEGAVIKTNYQGECWIALRLPAEKKFRVGTKSVVLTDSPTNSEEDASTYCEAFFVAQGLVQQKQGTILTTRDVVQKERAVSQSTTGSRVVGYIDNPSCMAYSFIPKAPEGEEGIFLDKVNLYLKDKHPTLGIWCEVREMDSAGGITRNQVPFSEVWIDSADLVVSDDGTVPQPIQFKSPIFLYNDTQYAFVIHTIGLNPDTYIWIQRLGETNITTGEKVTARPLTGTLYTTNNNLNWDIVPDVDLKIDFYRCKFQTGIVGQATISNKPFERLKISNVSAAFSSSGEPILGNHRLTLSGNTSGIIVGNRLLGNTSGANGAVTSINGSVFMAANNSFVSGERVQIYTSGMVDTGNTSLVTSIASSKGVISKYRATSGVIVDTGQELDVMSSNGSFVIGDTITGLQSGRTATVDAIRNLRYSMIDFEPSYIKFVKTDVRFEMQTTSNTGISSQYQLVGDNENRAFLEEQAIFSRTNEVASLGGDYSNKVRINMLTSSDYLTPVVDLGRTHSVYVDNIINSNTHLELEASGGYLINKYISLPVTLEEGQDAEDMVLKVTAYRPPTTDIKVWIKLLHAEDGQPFNQTKWIEMEKVNDSVYSSISNTNDFREFSFKFPDSYMTGPNGEVQYLNNQGILNSGYKHFAVKIGLINDEDNSAIVPRVADLRSVCIQMLHDSFYAKYHQETEIVKSKRKWEDLDSFIFGQEKGPEGSI